MTTLVNVNVRNIAVGGSGVGEVFAQEDGGQELLGITAFVPFSAVGEVVAARVTAQKKRYVNAELVTVERPSPDRVTPPCPYFTICGGCELQHISHEGQLRSKFEMVRSALQAGRHSSEVIERLNPIIADEPFHYRRRVNLHVDPSGKVGFYRESSRSVVAIEQCIVSVPSINEALTNIQDFGRRVAGKISSILLEADSAGVVAVLKSPYDLTLTERQQIIGAAKEFFKNATLMVGEREVGGFGRQILELPLNAGSHVTLRVPAGYFTQVNWKINQRLIAEVVDLSGIRHGAEVLDLFAGAGNFSLPAAKAGGQVVAIEVDKRLALFAKENAARNGLEKSLEVVETSVERYLDSKEGRRPRDVIIADPPRSGLGKLTSSIGEAQRLLLISCQLPSFVRDLKSLCELGWKVHTIQPFDMFAQTSYVETLAVLTR